MSVKTIEEITDKSQFSVASFAAELDNILSYWKQYTVDEENGGFYGSVSNDNVVDASAVKGSVLNARILWAFSAAYNLTHKKDYLAIAHRSVDYIFKHFVDAQYGGIYWSVDSEGKPADTKKQVYALAFAIYGLSEYYTATKNEEALSAAIAIYEAIEQHSCDKDKGGYLEALTENWQTINDLRLSDKDANEKKTMNTHLHILEAYTNLYRVWPDAELAVKIRSLIGIFKTHIVDAKSSHLILFFDEEWNVKSNIVSYGHDIEASWLLLEAAEVLADEKLIEEIRELAVEIAEASANGLAKDGSMYYEYEPAHNHLDTDKHWWVQAEAVVGFYNAYLLTKEASFHDKSVAVWNFIQRRIIDHNKGEWHWGVAASNLQMTGYDKAGFWKCPYHNSRACIEMIKRLS